MIPFLPDHFYTASPTMKRMPNLQEHAFPVFLPLMIPKAQLSNTISKKNHFPLRVAL